MTQPWHRFRPSNLAERTALHAAWLLAVVLSLWIGYQASPHAGWSDLDYGVGDFATSAIRAPYDLSVTDDAATARKRDEAARLTAPVALLDPDTGTRLADRFARAFEQARQLFEDADTRRTVSDAELKPLSRAARAALQRQREAEAEALVAAQIEDRLAAFGQATGADLRPEARALLVEDRFSRALADAVSALIADGYRHPVAADPIGLRLAMLGDGRTVGPERIVIHNTVTGAERTVTSLADVQSLDELGSALSARTRVVLADLDEQRRELVVWLVRPRLRPNLVLDAVATEARRAAAAEAVIPVSLTFRRNQLIVGEGQAVTPEARLVLDHLRQAGLPATYVRRLAATGGLTLLFLLTTGLVAIRSGWRRATAPRDLLFVSATLLATTVALGLWVSLVDLIVARGESVSRLAVVLAFPIAAPAMLARLLVGLDVAVGLAVLVAVTGGLVAEPGLPVTVHAAVTGALAAHLVSGCTRRGCVLRAGAWTSPIAAASAAAVALVSGDGSTLAVLGVALAGACSPVLAALATVALSRVAEWTFGYSSGISLIEMVSYEHPLLRRLMTEAPGTFQHSVSIGILASAAADAIGADALSLRVGALYHDVGKTTSPSLYVENQAGVNPHASLDPEESARLIRGHVEEGVRLVREHHLGERVADFVREHHGTDLIRYFLARAEARGGPVSPEAFAYPGPRPRSRETALLMIADQVEATSRTMAGAPEADLREMVSATIERLRAGGQFDDAPLTLRDLATVRDTLVQMLVGLHHRRIAYPKAPGLPATTGPASTRRSASASAPTSVAQR